MEKISGHYRCAVETPMGPQHFSLVVEAEGDGFRGRAGGTIGDDSGSMAIEGKVDGETLRWTMALPKPMPLSVTCKATVSGDTIEGKVKAGIFGSYPLTGTRVTDCGNG